MKRSLKLIRNSTVSMLTPQQFGICECSIVAGRQHNHDWRKRGIDQQILIWPMEKRTYGGARSLVNFVPPGCFLCSFVSRECNAFLSFTFSRGKILLILQNQAQVPCPLKSFPENLPTITSGRKFWLQLSSLVSRVFPDPQWTPELDGTRPCMHTGCFSTCWPGRLQCACLEQRDGSRPGWEGVDNLRFHHTTQNNVQLKPYELFISGIFHVIFLNCGWPQVTETSESETVDKVGGTTILLCISENNFCPNFSFICSISGINSVLRWRLSHQNREFAETRTVYFCIPSAWYIGGNFKSNSSGILFSSVQSLSRVQVFVTPWTAAFQASLSITNSFSFLKLMSIESVMPSNYLILCHFLLLLPSILPSIRVFSSESVLHIRWPKYWSFSFSISPSNEYWTNLL